MHLEVVGLNHRTAPVETRERVAVSTGHFGELLSALSGMDGVAEGFVLSTCNRTELYAALWNGYHASEAMARLLADFGRMPLPAVAPHLYIREDGDAVRHLLRVASSIDSMVVGESEILAQVKDAHDVATEAGTVGGALDRLIHEALRVGKRVRTDTEIGQGAISVASVAVDLARSIFDDLSRTTVLVLGAGDTSEKAVRHLVEHGVRSVVVSNRTYQRAVELAEGFSGEAITFDSLAERFPSADIVIASTSAPHAVVTVDMVQQAMHRRRHRPLFLIDIAVPRDVDARVEQIEGVFLYNIDHLESVVAENQALRQREVERAEAIVQEEAASFVRWLRQQTVIPTIVALKERLEAISEAEVAKLSPKFETERDRELAQRLAHAITQKVLATPFKELKDAAESPERHTLMRGLRRLFGLRAEGED
jgi:glutamyl-tRNA reductase